SHLGNRLALISGAERKWSMKAFDVGNAFTRASIQHHRVAFSIPEQFWDGEEDDGRRLLLKALHGLPISPKLWGDQIAKDLRSLGWTEAAAEPGLWRKVDASGELIAILTIYVDGCVVIAKTDQLADELTSQVHKLHPVTMINMEKA
ncbi:unnamed protein product, partial [Amoebophrya sp. A25]